ncbi:MAG: 4Fe-4S binding protein [Desulfobacteraceae bacterium]|nr:4Fe-4S binding protein [Desulfobacteraceae bacterium]
MPDAHTTTIDSPTTSKRTLSLTALRRLTQALMLAIIGQWSFYGIFRCPFVVPYISCQNCPVITCHGRIFTVFWGFWLLLPVSVLLFGRAFCGWACPGGFVNQILGKIAPIKLRAKNLLARYGQAGQYVGLLLALVAYFHLGQLRANIPLRTGGFFESVGLTFEHSGMLWLVRTFIVIGFLVLGLLIANAWCRFACPTGGILEALKGLALFRFHKTKSCNDCDACLRVCEMGTRPGEVNCTNCGDCLGACPANAIRFGRKRSA